MKRVLLSVACTLIATCLAMPSAAVAQNYVYDPDAGGVVDLDTGLVWSFDVSGVTGSAFSYNGAVNLAPDLYSDSVWSHGYSDWRSATRAELVDAAGKGLAAELDFWAGVVGAPTSEDQGWHPSYNTYWSSTTAKKYRGQLQAYVVDLATGDSWATNRSNANLALVVRVAGP